MTMDDWILNETIDTRFFDCAFLRRNFFALFSYRGLFVILPLSQFGQDTGLFTLLFKAANGLIERFSVAYFNAWQ